MKILYVEDSPSDLYLLKKEFIRLAPDITVDHAPNCTEAKETLAVCALGDIPSYDAVLTDMNLPDGNGMSLIPFLQKKGMDIPVIVLTGLGSEESAVAALKAGAADYLVKHKDYLEKLPAILESIQKKRAFAGKGIKRSLRVLYGEHNFSDIDLTIHHFSHWAPFIRMDVVNKGEEVLKRFPVPGTSTKDGDVYDVLLIDYRLPDINGFEVLKELRDVRNVDTPIVIITGQGNEELAVRALRLGATDYVAKNVGYLYQLPGILENAFNRIQIERDRRALAASEEYFKTLVEKSTEIIQLVDEKGKPFYVSPSVSSILGYTPEEYLALAWNDLVHPDDMAAARSIVAGAKANPGVVVTLTERFRHKNGSWRWIECNIRDLRRDPVVKALVANFHDITEQKNVEAALRESEEQLRLKLDSILSPEADIAAEDLINVLDIPVIKNLMDGLHRMTNLNIALLGFNGKPLVETHTPDICAKFHLLHPESAKHCRESNRILTKGVSDGRYTMLTCKNNMREYVTPLYIGNKHIANIFIGQVLYDDEEIDREIFAKQAEKYGFDKESYLAALDAAPRFNREKVKETIEFLAQFASMISRLSYSNVKLAQAMIEQKRVGEQLKINEARYRTIFDNSPVALIELDGSLVKKFMDAINERGITDYGAYFFNNPEELRQCISLLRPVSINKAARELGAIELPNPDTYRSDTMHTDSLIKSIIAIAEGKNEVEHESFLQLGDGSRRYLHVHWTAIPGCEKTHERVLLSFIDLTERKEAEEMLRLTRERLSEAMDMARIVYWETDDERGIFILNDAFYDFMGTTAEQEGGYTMEYKKYIESFVHPDDAARVENNIKEHLSTAVVPGSVHSDEHRIIRRDGEMRHVFIRLRIVCDERGRKTGAIGSCQDITEPKQMQESLRESEEKYRSIVENAIVGVAVFQDRKFQFVNKKFCEIHGYDRDELIGTDMLNLLQPNDRHIVEEEWERRKEGGFTDREISLNVVRKDGEARTVGHFATAVTMNGKHAVVVIVTDITKEKILEQQLRQAQKMEAIGTLAGGVAHDFNNLLTVLTGYGTLLQMGLPTGDPLRPYTDQILAATQKAANLTRSLLAFGRQHPIALAPVDVNNTISETRKLLKQLLTEDVTLKTFLAEENTTILGDSTQIDQILFNLVSNARDAMPKGGSLTIETSIADLDEDFIHIHGLEKPGRYVLLTISDTGVGMDHTTRDKIFDPFFTTKEVGKGTGLGLATVYGVVKQHHGHITVYSEPGIGTTFHIYLPAVAAKVEEVRARTDVVRGGKETVLVAEDNEIVRRLMRDILKEYGYTVIETEDGQDAVDTFKKHKSTINLAIIDSVMPKKNGREAGDEMKAIKPDIKLLFTSGYTKDVILDKGVEDREIEFISKPLSPRSFLEKVREVLDKPQQ